MSKGRYEHKGRHRRRKFGSKSLALVLACVLLVGGVIGGTVAWLTAKTNEVTNVFTTSDIGVKLEETKKEFKMIPGWTIEKDPKATVESGSEDCYLFIKVEETGVSFTPEGEGMPKVYSFDDFLTYEIAEGWTKLEDGVYYKIFDSKDSANANEMGTAYSILKDDKVTVQETVTKEMMTDLKTYGVNPKLSFTAYAVQLYKNNTEKFTSAEAWAKISTN